MPAPPHTSRRFLLPGDKSISHRAVMYAGIAQGLSRIRNLSTGHDVASTRDCLSALGVRIERQGDEMLIEGNGLHGFRQPHSPLDCGNSGTTIRLLSGILSGHPFPSRLTGDKSLSMRPMRRIMEPLTAMGASFPESTDGRAPFTIQGAYPLQPIDYTMPMASAQVKSAILLAGLYADGRTIVRERWATRDHTERLFGASVTKADGVRIITMSPSRDLSPLDISIPADPSSAAFIVVAAMLLGLDDVILASVSSNPTRTAYLSILQRHGLSVSYTSAQETYGEPVADIVIHRSRLEGEVRLSEDNAGLIDEIPVLSVAAACSGMPFVVRNAEELRFKESDRIELLVKNLRSIGCDVEEYPDGFASRPKNGLIGAVIETRGDHRIAMAFGLAGLVIDGISVDDTACADVSFPGFWEILSTLRRSRQT